MMISFFDIFFSSLLRQKANSILKTQKRKVEKMNQTVNKFSNYVFFVVFISIFLELKFPLFHWVSLIGMVVLYGLNLVKEKLSKGRIHPASIVLCMMAISWILLRPYVKSGYVAIYGQLVIYGYLIYTQWQLLGKVRKSFVAYAAAAVSVSFLSLKFPGILTSILVLGMQAWIIFQFLDPILYNIAMLHRKKRLAEEAKRNQEETDVEEKSSDYPLIAES